MKMVRNFSFFTCLPGIAAARQRYYHLLALLVKTKKSNQPVARSIDKVFYHIFMTCKCFMVINIRWLLSLFYTISHLKSSFLRPYPAAFYTISHICSSSYVLA